MHRRIAELLDMPSGRGAGRIGTIELRHLRALVAVAEELHFGHAAIRVHVAQSTLSRTLAELESIVGVRLVERGHRTLGLTDAGRVLVGAAEAVLAGIGEGIEAARGASDRPLALGLLDSLGHDWLPAARRALERGGEERLRVCSIDRSQGMDPLKRDVDVGVFPLPLTPVPGLAHSVLGESRPWVALPRRHPLAAGPSVVLARLLRDRLILPPMHPLWLDNLELLARAQGMSLTLGPTTQSLYETLALVARGHGWTIAASRADLHPWEGVALRPTAGFERARIAAVWDESRATPRTLQLVEALETAARELARPSASPPPGTARGRGAGGRGRPVPGTAGPGPGTASPAGPEASGPMRALREAARERSVATPRLRPLADTAP